MSNKSIVEVFGIGVTMDVTDPANPILQIPYSAVSEASGSTTPPTSGTTSGENWFAAILLKAKTFFDSVSDATNSITISAPSKIATTRNGQAKIGYSLTLIVYQPDVSSNLPDPDSV